MMKQPVSTNDYLLSNTRLQHILYATMETNNFYVVRNAKGQSNNKTITKIHRILKKQKTQLNQQ